MKNKPYLSIIIPAFNEEARIGHTLRAIAAYVDRQPYDAEMIVVLDGATDNTLAVVQQVAHDRSDLRWIDRRQNRGKGYSVRQGMLAAQGEIRLFTDADNATDISHFDEMQLLFESGSDVVIASRDAKDVSGAQQAVPQSFLKRALGNLGNLFIQFVAVPGIWDTQCGFKAFRAEAAQTIFSRARADGWVFDIEALALARKFNYRVDVIAANWINDARSKVRASDYFKSLLDTVKVRWNLLTGAYEQGRPQQAQPQDSVPVEGEP